MPILVTGATGSVGRLVVDHLLAQGAMDVRALTTNPAKAALPAEVEVVEGYIGKPETMPAALDGVERMYLAPLPETAAEVAALAAEAGVQHVVDLSGEPGSWWYEVVAGVEAAGVAEHPQPAAGTVNAVTGRPATAFAEWARQHGADFR